MRHLITFVKKSLLFAGKVLLLITGFLIIYFLSAFCLSRLAVPKEKDKAEITIYIKTNGVHTDIVVPAISGQMDWTCEIKFSNTKKADSQYSYLAMGWGDKGFYLETPEWANLKASVAFKAAFALSTSAIHATYYKELVEDAACKKIHISKRQYGRLVKYISNSFKKGDDGHFIPIKTNANYGDTDAFYEANGSYSLFRTCNTWANSGLKSCGQTCCYWTIFDKGIFLKYP